MLDPEAAAAFEALSLNQRALARGLEDLSDALACLALSIMERGHIDTATYKRVRRRVERRRKRLRGDSDDQAFLAKLFKATKPSEN